jgi:hypothetical protein
MHKTLHYKMETRYRNRVTVVFYFNDKCVLEDTIEVHTNAKLHTALIDCFLHKYVVMSFDIEKLEVIQLQKHKLLESTVRWIHFLTNDDVIDHETTFRRYGIISTNIFSYILKVSIKNVK